MVLKGVSVATGLGNAADRDGSQILLGDEDSLQTISRIVLVSELEARVLRARHCRSVPASVILYAIFIASLLFRMPVEKTFEFERG